MLNELSRPKSIYPSLSGIETGLKCLIIRPLPGENLTDTIGLAGTLLLFPEHAGFARALQHLITLGHQIDHHYDSLNSEPKKGKNKQSIIYFNHLYSDFLQKLPNEDLKKEDKKILVKSSLGFFTQAMIVEQQYRYKLNKSKGFNSFIKREHYRQLMNAIWVRMAISFCNGISGQQVDPISFKSGELEEIAELYKPFISGQSLDNIPQGKKSYVLFLWTMAIQAELDSYSLNGNNPNINPVMENDGKKYIDLAVKKGVNRIWLNVTLVVVNKLSSLRKFKSII